jgi:phosphoserine phosphatase
MIPLFDNSGNLPPGVHEATLAQIEKRFAQTPVRKRLFAGLKRLAKALKAAGCKTLFISTEAT